MNVKTSTAISTEQVSDRATVVRWRIVWLLMAFSFMCHFNRIGMSVAGTERIMMEYDISKVQIGTVYSAYLLAYTLCMIPGGWLIDRIGAKFALVVMGFGSAILVVLTGCIGFFAIPALILPSLWLVRSLTGLVSAPMHPGAARAVAAWMPQQSRTLANGMITAAALIGIASTYYVFGAMIDQFGWPMAFVISGVITFSLAVVWTLYSTNSPAGHYAVDEAELRMITGYAVVAVSRDEAWIPWYALLRNRSLVLLTLSYAAIGYFQYLFFFWLQYYFDTVLGLGREASRFYTTIPMLAMAGGMFLGGWIADELCQRIGPRKGRASIAMLGMLGGTIFLGLGIVAEDPHWIVMWFSCAMASVGLSEGPFWVTAIELGGSRGGASAAIFNTGGNAGGILAPVVTPWLSEYIGWQGAMPVAGLFCLIGAMLWFWIYPDQRVA